MPGGVAEGIECSVEINEGDSPDELILMYECGTRIVVGNLAPTWRYSRDWPGKGHPHIQNPLKRIGALVTDVLEGRRQYVDTYGDEAATLLARDIETILRDHERS